MNVLERVRGGLIVSVQAEADSVLNTPETIALLARCAVQNGAAGLRIEGIARIRAVRAALGVPIVGLIKRVTPGFEPYITPTLDDATALVAAGADVVAFDATSRARQGGVGVADFVRVIHDNGALALADCAVEEDGMQARVAGADAVATTLAGYTPGTLGRDLPALDVTAQLAALHSFAICEGGIASPEQARAAFEAGASAVVVGSAISNVDLLVQRFVRATPRGGSAERSG